MTFECYSKSFELLVFDRLYITFYLWFVVTISPYLYLAPFRDITVFTVYASTCDLYIWGVNKTVEMSFNIVTKCEIVSMSLI